MNPYLVEIIIDAIKRNSKINKDIQEYNFNAFLNTYNITDEVIITRLKEYIDNNSYDYDNKPSKDELNKLNSNLKLIVGNKKAIIKDTDSLFLIPSSGISLSKLMAIIFFINKESMRQCGLPMIDNLNYLSTIKGVRIKELFKISKYIQHDNELFSYINSNNPDKFRICLLNDTVEPNLQLFDKPAIDMVWDKLGYFTGKNLSLLTRLTTEGVLVLTEPNNYFEKPVPFNKLTTELLDYDRLIREFEMIF